MNFIYEPVSQSWPNKFLISHESRDVIATRPQNSSGTHFVVSEFTVHNRSGADVIVGVGGRIQASVWRFYTWTESAYAAGNVLTDVTDGAQNVTAGDVNLDTVGAANDGFAIGCDVPFNVASLVISQLSGAGTVWASYYSVASSSTGFSNNFKPLSNLYVSPNFSATGEQVIWFEPPPDWHRVQPDTALVNRHGRSNRQALGHSAPPQYLFVVKSLTPPGTTRGQMTIATIGRAYMSTVGVADTGLLTNIGGAELHLPGACDAIAAVISESNPQHRVDLKYRYAG